MSQVHDIFHTCDENFGVVRFREGHRMKAGIRSRGDLTRGEADVAYRHRQRLTSTRRGQQGLLCYATKGSDDWHIQLPGKSRGDTGTYYKSLKHYKQINKN